MQASPLPAEGAEPTAAVEAAPLISGPTELLWTGAGAFFLIFVLVFTLLTRWRAGRRARDIAANTEFFKPAGEGAEITFDDAEPPASAPEKTEPSLEEIFAAAEKAPKKKSFFLGRFFGKKDDGETPAESTSEPAATAEVIDLGAESDGLASVRIERAPRSVFATGRHEEGEASGVGDWASIERAEQRRREEEAERAAIAERQRQEEEEAQFRRLRAEDDERRRLADEDRRRAEREATARIEEFERSRAASQPVRLAETEGRAHTDDLVRTLSEVEEALHAQREAIQAETRNLLDSFARRFSDRLDSLAATVEQRSALRIAEAPGGVEMGADLAGVADLIARRLDDQQREFGKSIAALGRRIDSLAAAERQSPGEASRPDQAGAPLVQLAEIVRNALAPNAYEFNAVLPNNRRADCLIKLGRPPGPIAVDARFPLEAFHALRVTRADAETEFRRTALRHIVDVAERLIAPGLTADSALMFIPSESMVADLHARFPDVVQDSYRARVWIVSPTTLMATLHTISGVMRDAASLAGAPNDAKRALAEIERLTERIAALESHAPRARPAIAGAAQGEPANPWRTEPSGEEGERPLKRYFQPPADRDAAHPSGDLYADDPSEERGADIVEPARTTRPPFPLR